MPNIRDEDHAIKLLNIGYATLKLKPSKHKRSEQQLKLATVLRLIRERGHERGRVLPFKKRKRPKQSAAA
ncbi:unnamed protein product [Phytophthora lilii]|uniref:Unnamed protein product n=1 Tax=Phytophthora lilii TaxID=2077276 RepID=A0A9W6TVV4_9STRA|nr:unnamed protein product [Phytophthora lilii]